MDNKQLEFNFEFKGDDTLHSTYFKSMREWVDSLETCYIANNYIGVRESRHMLNLMLEEIHTILTNKLHKKRNISTY